MAAYGRVAGFIALVGSTTAAMASINYGDFNGTNVNFLQVTEDSNTDNRALFGQPLLAGDSLLFFPSGFASSSTNGASDETTGLLIMTVKSNPGQFIKSIKVSEVGDYSLAGVGTGSTYASVNGTLSGFAPQNGNTYNAPWVVSPTGIFQLPGDTSGAWTASTVIDVTGLGLSQLDLVFTATLKTGSEAGTASFIQRKVIGGPVLRVEIPAPGAMALVAGGAILGFRRRR